LECTKIIITTAGATLETETKVSMLLIKPLLTTQVLKLLDKTTMEEEEDMNAQRREIITHIGLPHLGRMLPFSPWTKLGAHFTRKNPKTLKADSDA